jgi:hypothetical protein
VYLDGLLVESELPGRPATVGDLGKGLVGE